MTGECRKAARRAQILTSSRALAQVVVVNILLYVYNFIFIVVVLATSDVSIRTSPGYDANVIILAAYNLLCAVGYAFVLSLMYWRLKRSTTQLQAKHKRTLSHMVVLISVCAACFLLRFFMFLLRPAFHVAISADAWITCAYALPEMVPTVGLLFLMKLPKRAKSRKAKLNYLDSSADGGASAGVSGAPDDDSKALVAAESPRAARPNDLDEDKKAAPAQPSQVTIQIEADPMESIEDKLSRQRFASTRRMPRKTTVDHLEEDVQVVDDHMHEIEFSDADDADDEDDVGPADVDERSRSAATFETLNRNSDLRDSTASSGSASRKRGMSEAVRYVSSRDTSGLPDTRPAPGPQHVSTRRLQEQSAAYRSAASGSDAELAAAGIDGPVESLLFHVGLEGVPKTGDFQVAVFASGSAVVAPTSHMSSSGMLGSRSGSDLKTGQTEIVHGPALGDASSADFATLIPLSVRGVLDSRKTLATAFRFTVYRVAGESQEVVANMDCTLQHLRSSAMWHLRKQMTLTEKGKTMYGKAELPNLVIGIGRVELPASLRPILYEWPHVARPFLFSGFASDGTTEHRLHVVESMAESPFTFSLAFGFVLLRIEMLRWKRQRVLARLHNLALASGGDGGVSLGSGMSSLLDGVKLDVEEEQRRGMVASMEKLFDEEEAQYRRIASMYGAHASSYKGISFKPSTYKADSMMRFVATNLHTQDMYVGVEEAATGNHVTDASYTTVTVGAPAAHVHGFRSRLTSLVPAQNAASYRNSMRSSRPRGAAWSSAVL